MWLVGQGQSFYPVKFSEYSIFTFVNNRIFSQIRMGFIINNTFVGTKALTSLQISLNKPRLRRLQELEEHEIHLKFGLKKRSIVGQDSNR